MMARPRSQSKLWRKNVGWSGLSLQGGLTYFSHNSLKLLNICFLAIILYFAQLFICFHHNFQNVVITILIQTMLTNILCSLFESMKKKELRKLLTHFLKVKNGQRKGNDKEKIHNHDKIQTNSCCSSTRASSLLGRNVSPAFRFSTL